MANFFRSFLPCFLETATPLTDLFKSSGPGHQRLAWSVACQASFEQIKVSLTSTPVLQHFDPTLRTPVHIDGSQNAVGAVLLQWHPGETDPRPVAFMSRKLSGAQYCYDARNVEALAPQMVLTTWHMLLLDIKFEIYLDRFSGFTQTNKQTNKQTTIVWSTSSHKKSRPIISYNSVNSWWTLILLKLSMYPGPTMWYQIFCLDLGVMYKRLQI